MRMDVFQAVAERQAKLVAALKGKHGRLRAPSLSRYAYPLTKDRLGYTDSAMAPAATDEGRMACTFVISTLRQDRDGDVVLPDGFDLSNYRKNPLFFFGHQLWEIPVGTAEDPDTKQLAVKIEPGKRVLATCFFDQDDEDAVFLYGKVARGILRATSIGFMPLEAERIQPTKAQSGDARANEAEPFPGWIFQRIDLLEISIVGVPSNADAIRQSLSNDKISSKMRKALTPFAGTAPIWANGFTPALESNAMSRKWKKAKPKPTVKTPSEEDLEGTQESPAEEEAEGRGSDIQAVFLPKASFAKQEDAVKWVEEHDLDATQMTEDDESFTFMQFPADQCATDSTRREDLVDGVQGVVCQLKVEEGANNEGPPAAQAAGKTVEITKLCAGCAAKAKQEAALDRWIKDTQDCVSNKIRILVGEGKDPKQAAAIAYSMCGEKGKDMGEAVLNEGEQANNPEDRNDEGKPEKLGVKYLRGIIEHTMTHKDLLEHPAVAKMACKTLQMAYETGTKAYPEADEFKDGPEFETGEKDENADEETVGRHEDEKEEDEEEKKSMRAALSELRSMKEEIRRAQGRVKANGRA